LSYGGSIQNFFQKFCRAITITRIYYIYYYPFEFKVNILIFSQI